MEIPPREMVLAPVLPTQGLVMLYAPRGIGKTVTALGMAYAVASGNGFLRRSAPEPRRVLYLDGEMPAGAIKERLAWTVFGSDAAPPAVDFLTVFAADLQPDGFPDLSTTEGQAAVEEYIDGVSLLVIDNLSTLFRQGRENEAESWDPVQQWLLDLRRRGISVLIVHHDGKGSLAVQGRSSPEIP